MKVAAEILAGFSVAVSALEIAVVGQCHVEVHHESLLMSLWRRLHKASLQLIVKAFRHCIVQSPRILTETIVGSSSHQVSKDGVVR